jgi:phage FluMu protein Com
MRERSGNSDPVKVVKDNDSLRCCCGSLLARLVPDGVELKCRRCKRHLVIPLNMKIASSEES